MNSLSIVFVSSVTDLLEDLVNYMESDEKLAATSGLIYFGDSKSIYSAGGYVTDHWTAGSICGNILDIRPAGKPFIDETFYIWMIIY